MAAYTPLTRSSHSMFDMASMLQKSIRRADFQRAGYAAYELWGNYSKYLWRRLIIISAEDCYGIITKEIVALKLADDICNDGRKGYDRDPLFVAKAITLLCAAKKNRDACYFACNYMTHDSTIDPQEIEHIDIARCRLDGDIPDWVFDYHTLTGRKNGKTDLDMIKSEQAALTPLQMGFFDHNDWGPYFQLRLKKGEVGQRELNEYVVFQAGKNHD